MENHEAATSILACGEVIEYLKPRTDFPRRYRPCAHAFGRSAHTS